MGSFKPVDFDIDENEILEELSEKVNFNVKKIEYEFDRDKFDKAIKKVKHEIDLIGNGLSELTSHGIQVEDRLPSLHSLKQLELDPFPNRLNTFLNLAAQDFGIRVKKEFTKYFEEVFTECPKK